MTSSSNKYSGGESGTGHSTSDFQFPMNSSGPAVDSKPPASGRQHGAGQSSLDSSTGGRNGVFHYRSTISPRSSSVSPRGANIYSAAGMLGTSAVSMFSNPAAVPMYSIPFGSTGSTIGVGGGTKQISGSLIRDNREKEKRELCELNDRFANYVERVRFLEALNKKLKLEADALKSRLGKNGDKIKNMYETELREARKLIDETMKNQKDLVLKTQRADDDGNRIRDRYEQLVKSSDDERLKMAHLSKELAENEATLCLLNRRVADLDEEAKRYKAESHALAQDLQRANSDLYHEAGMRIQLQNDKQSLEEELSFIKQIHAQEMEELKDMLSRDSTLDPSKFFQHELSSAIKDIRKEYDTLNQQQKQEMENWYRMKVTNAVQELQAKKLSETKHLPRDEDIKSLHQQITGIKKDSLLSRQKNHELEYKVHELQRLLEQEKDDGSKTVNSCNQVIFDLQMKLDQMLNDYEQLLSNNSNLNSEISLYRKLLEGGENDRSGLKHIVEGIERSVIGDWTGDRTMAALSSQSKPDIDEHAMEAEEHGKSEEEEEEEEEEEDEMPIDERVKETGQTREGERRWGEIKEVMTREPFSKIARAVTFKPTGGVEDHDQSMTEPYDPPLFLRHEELQPAADDDDDHSMKKTEAYHIGSRQDATVNETRSEAIPVASQLRAGSEGITIENEPEEIILQHSGVKEIIVDTASGYFQRHNSLVREDVQEARKRSKSVLGNQERPGLASQLTSEQPVLAAQQSFEDSHSQESSQPSHVSDVIITAKHSTLSKDHKQRSRGHVASGGGHRDLPVTDLTSQLQSYSVETAVVMETRDDDNDNKPPKYEESKHEEGSRKIDDPRRLESKKISHHKAKDTTSQNQKDDEEITETSENLQIEGSQPSEKTPTLSGIAGNIYYKGKDLVDKGLEMMTKHDQRHDRAEQQEKKGARSVSESKYASEAKSADDTSVERDDEDAKQKQDFSLTSDYSGAERRSSLKDSGLPSSPAMSSTSDPVKQILVDISYNRQSGRLALIAKRARHFEPSDGEAYIRCTLLPDRLKQKSHAVSLRENPFWNTLFEFDVKSLQDCKSRSLLLVVKRHQQAGGDEDPQWKSGLIGRVKLPLNEVNLNSGVEDQWLSLSLPTSMSPGSDSSDATA